MEINENIKPKARKDIHKVILQWFSKQTRGKVLDAPAGFGHLSMHLKKEGFMVTSGEIEPDIFMVEGIDCIYTDLNSQIDAPDETFDYVCCVDGLEHMTDPYTAVHEFSRVLKPGGYAVFSVPNWSNIEKRIGFMMKGYLTKPKSVEDFRASGSNLFNFHNSPLTITLLDLIFSINNLKIEKILKDKVKRKQYFLLPLIMVLKLISLLTSKEKRLKKRHDLTLRNDVILGGNTAIYITVKKESRDD